jgi:hypothetical protein
MPMKSSLPALITALMLAVTCAAMADDAAPPRLVVIVHPDSGVDALTNADAVNIFMGRYRKLPSGLVALPVDIDDRSAERRQFYRMLVRKDLAEIDAYWARLIFSGQTSPPLKVPDGHAALHLVASNRAAIAYVDRTLVDERVRIVMDLDSALAPAP